MNDLRVFLVDDEPLLLESLEIILKLNNIRIAGTASDGTEALSVLEHTSADMALVDLNMKGMGGIELIGRLKIHYPQMKILVLTTFYDDKNITEAIANGADGYILKDSGKEAIIGAIGQIMGGRNVIDNKVMQRLARLMNESMRTNHNAENNSRIIKSQNKPEPEILLRDMTSREKEICTLLAKGYTNKQIAAEMYISEGTVKNYISSIYDKTGIHDRAKLIVALHG